MENPNQQQPDTTPQASQTAPKQPPDQKTIDALLAVTRAEMQQEAARKLEEKQRNGPQGFISSRVNKMATTFNPSDIASSSTARNKAIVAVVIFVVLSLLGWLAGSLIHAPKI